MLTRPFTPETFQCHGFPPRWEGGGAPAPSHFAPVSVICSEAQNCERVTSPRGSLREGKEILHKFQKRRAHQSSAHTMQQFFNALSLSLCTERASIASERMCTDAWYSDWRNAPLQGSPDDCFRLWHDPTSPPRHMLRLRHVPSPHPEANDLMSLDNPTRPFHGSTHPPFRHDTNREGDSISAG
jgi:hypothetical protein